MIFDSGTFDQDLIEDFLQHYTLDTILMEVNKPASYQVFAFLGNIQSTSMLIDTRIFKPYSSYLLDCMLILGKNDPRFQESIINALIWSFGRAFEDLSESISMMGLRLQLPYAVPDDLDLYWSRILGLKRRYSESDEAFRERLATRLATMKSSGTRPECEAILDHILGLPGASRLETYWPGDVRVCWNSYTAMRAAQDNYAAIKEALDAMIAAGCSWSTAFPWISMQIASYITGKHSLSCSIDAGISREKYQMMLLRTELFDAGAISESISANLEKTHLASCKIASRLIARYSMAQSIASNIETWRSASEPLDAHLHQVKSKSASYDMISAKLKSGSYRLDGFAERERQGFCLIATELAA